jgi:transcriptional regulator with XRE-family HTH domain
MRLSQDGLIERMAAIAADQAPTRRTLSKWENNHTSPTVDELVLIAKATGPVFTIEWYVQELDETPDGPEGTRDLGIPSTRCSVLTFPSARNDHYALTG